MSGNFVDMRKSTLAIAAYLFSFAIVYLGMEIFYSQGFRLPFGLPIGILALLLMPLFLFLLNFLNKYVLAWRKERGRDIEEEEKYETDTGFISLTPKDENEK